MDSHGGYLSLLEHGDAAALVRLARQALAEEGCHRVSCALAVSRVPGKKVIRLAFDSPHTYGRRGAAWYQEHHALARLLSAHFNTRVHAYAIDAEEFEQVSTYACGRPVGGEGIHYDDVDAPADGADDGAFEEIQSRWPLGHLARILGVTRADLVQLPRFPTVLLELDAEAPPGRLADILSPTP